MKGAIASDSHMNYNHLVVLGTKANSWAWCIEQLQSITKSGIKVSAINFDANDNKCTPRSRFQAQFTLSHGIQVIDVRKNSSEAIQRSIKLRTNAWIKANSENPDWVQSKIDDLPIGRIVMSNYARIAGTSTFSLSLVPRKLQFKLVSTALLADFAYTRFGRQFAEISLSNGRSPIEAVFLIRARGRNQKVNVMERGATTKQWHIFKNSPHYPVDWWNMLLEVSSSTPRKSLEEKSSAYWNTRLGGWDELSDRNWREEFDDDSVPETVTSNSVIFFSTSQHEIPVIEEFDCPNLGFGSQQLAVRKLVESCEKLGKHLVVKRHPNSVDLEGIDHEAPEWEWLQSITNVTYLEPKSRVDTSALIRKAGAVLTYRSSTGVEASAMRVPARAMGPAEWAYCNEARVWDGRSLESFLTNPVTLNPIIHESWGFMAGTFGKNLECFSDIRGGYALTPEGVKIYADAYYERSLRKSVSKLFNREWFMKFRGPRQ